MIKLSRCVGIESFHEFTQTDFSQVKELKDCWFCIYLSDHKLIDTLDFVAKLRNKVSACGQLFFRAIVFSSSKHRSAINQSFGGSAVMIRHVDDKAYKDCLDEFNLELEELFKELEDNKSKRRNRRKK